MTLHDRSYNSDRTWALVWLVIPSIIMPTCIFTWSRLRSAVDLAKSVAPMVSCTAVNDTWAACNVRTAGLTWNFWKPPSRDRASVTRALADAAISVAFEASVFRSYDLNTDASKATEIAASAKALVTEARSRLGGFQKFQVNPAVRTLQAAQVSLTAVQETIGATDFAKSTADLNRDQVKMQVGMMMLGMTNQTSAQVLSLL